MVIAISLIFLVKYTYPKKTYSNLSGIFIDDSSYRRGVNVVTCDVVSIGQTSPGQYSDYWFGCNIAHYSPPLTLRLYFPFDVRNIVSEGVCSEYYNGIVLMYSYLGSEDIKINNVNCYHLNSSLINNNILEINFSSNDTPPLLTQIKISANLFQKETEDKYVFRAFQINSNPLPFIHNGFSYSNNEINYSIKIKRDEYKILSSESNFIPAYQNEITSDYNYERIVWSSRNMPTESYLYISDLNKEREKGMATIVFSNLFFLLIGILIEKFLKKYS